MASIPGTHLTELRHQHLSRFHDALDGHPAVEMTLVVPDDQGVGFTVGVDEFALEQDVGLEVVLVVACVIIAIGFEHIGQHVGKVGAGERLQQELQAVVEFVVADIRRVVTQEVHGLVHRMHLALTQATSPCDVVAHRIALQEIAVQIGRLHDAELDLGSIERSGRETRHACNARRACQCMASQRTSNFGQGHRPVQAMSSDPSLSSFVRQGDDRQVDGRRGDDTGKKNPDSPEPGQPSLVRQFARGRPPPSLRSTAFHAVCRCPLP